MSQTNELRAIDRFLYEHLTGSAPVAALVGNRVFETLAPEGAVTPFIVFAFVSARDVNTYGAGQRSFTEATYRIAAVNQDDGADTVGLVADAFEAALTGLQNVSLTPEGVTLMGIFRTAPLRTVEEINGKRYSTVGGLFRIFASKFS
jgi:hypothetical protein